jgi:hypothetical protein
MRPRRRLGGVLQHHRVPVFGVAVATTISRGIIDPAIVDHAVFRALVARSRGT